MPNHAAGTGTGPANCVVAFVLHMTRPFAHAEALSPRLMATLCVAFAAIVSKTTVMFAGALLSSTLAYVTHLHAPSTF